MTEQPLIEVRNLTKKFKDFEAIKTPGVSLKIMPKEVLVIIGSSGSGKSTLLRCMNRLIEPTSGQVFFDGVEITDKEINIDDVRKNIGMVFQAFNLFLHLTVGENIALPLKKVLRLSEDDIEKRVKDNLRAVNLSEKEDSYPGELSGGQQQRVAIARVLAMRPKLIFFDEPTSALDPELTGEVLSVMKKLVTDFHYTLVIVTHEIPFAKEMATRVIFMDEGEIIYRGPPGDVFENPSNERLKKFLSKILEMH
ncbi:amino acid ABC transporter ATP-binding protein [Promethearchaeum syntrophicum]|uniref:Amino acid ABC transporter ATP-binding protein n=1 Tax=Promethearchaeum syntrophicum TaxID=2594042 RepID=A0A5B9D525_9ARCH|nr:amino acid ABC transporter ATP-binding protein [Candidatus Prometheoarchaeum syntrophicum]QEE14209.1 putative ABC transporter ATP-binding protein [Candidatus Prometheoarchaeum syntrophicum]